MLVCLWGQKMPVIYNADGPVTCPSAYTRTGTVVTSRLFDYEWSMLHQQNPERTTSDAAQRARPVSSGCHPRLTRLSLRHHRSSKPSSPELPTAAPGSPSVLHSHPLLQFRLRPIRGTQILSSGVWVRPFWSMVVFMVRAMSLRCRREH